MDTPNRIRFKILNDALYTFQATIETNLAQIIDPNSEEYEKQIRNKDAIIDALASIGDELDELKATIE